MFVAAVVGLTGTNAYSTIHHFLGEPQSAFSEDNLLLEELTGFIPPGSSVCLSERPEIQGPTMGAVSYFLMGYPLHGKVKTAHSPQVHLSLDYDGDEGRFFHSMGQSGKEIYLCDYALLAAGENPAERGYSYDDLLWANRDIKVYGRGATLARLESDEAEGAWVISNTRPFAVSVRAPSDRVPAANHGVNQYLAFEFGGFSNHQVIVEIGSEEHLVDIRPGIWRYETGPVTLPGTVTVRGNGTDRVFLRSLELRDGAEPEPSISWIDGFQVWRSAPTRDGNRIVMQVQWVGSPSPTWLGFVEARVKDVTESGEGTLVGEWGLDGTPQELQVTLDPLQKAIEFARPGFTTTTYLWDAHEQEATYVLEFSVVCPALTQQQTIPLFPVARAEDSAAGAELVEQAPSYSRGTGSPWVPSNARFGEVVRLLGYRLTDRLLRPGGEAHLTLYWQVPDDFDRDLRVFAHLVDLQWQVWGQQDKSLLSARRFRTGPGGSAILRTRHSIPVDDSASTGKYHVAVGVYMPDTLERLTIVGGDTPLSDRVVTQWMRVAGSDASMNARSFRPAHVKELDLGGQIRLLGYDLKPSRPASGSEVQLTLYWQAQRKMHKDYTVFVHLLDGESRIVAQDDSQPLQARYPTSVWSPGEVVADRHTLILGRVAPGVYHVAVGMYLGTTGERLAPAGSSQSGDSHISLKNLKVGR